MDDDLLLTTFPVKAVYDSGRCGLVNDPEYVEASNRSGVLGIPLLCVVEVDRDSDNGVGDRLPKIQLSDLLRYGEDHRSDFLWFLRDEKAGESIP